MTKPINTDGATVVLVHGAFADASSWNGVVEHLLGLAERAGARITELEGSHVIMISQPEAVSSVILGAVTASTKVLVEA